MVDAEQCLAFQCPIQFVVDLSGNKGSILLLRELFEGDRRTYELLAALPGREHEDLDPTAAGVGRSILSEFVTALLLFKGDAKGRGIKRLGYVVLLGLDPHKNF